MPTALEITAVAILDACVDSDLGIIVRVIANPNVREISMPTYRAKQVLYRFRKEYPRPEYRAIQIRLSPDDPDNELWLLKTDEFQTTGDSKPEPEPLTLNIDDLWTES